jgi:hypothetical protein
MSTQPKVQPDHLQKLKTSLEDAPRNYDFLAEYVRELEICREDEDIFLRLAFQNSSSGGSYRGTGPFIVSVVSEMYEPLDAERKLEIRQWWHEKVRGEANQVDDLKMQLTRIT